MMEIKAGRLISKREPPKPSNLKGNIAVVFAILLGGLILSALVFWYEFRLSINRQIEVTSQGIMRIRRWLRMRINLAAFAPQKN